MRVDQRSLSIAPKRFNVTVLLELNRVICETWARSNAVIDLTLGMINYLVRKSRRSYLNPLFSSS